MSWGTILFAASRAVMIVLALVVRAGRKRAFCPDVPGRYAAVGPIV